jgi:uncharacterized protein (DUF1778 family)
MPATRPRRELSEEEAEEIRHAARQEHRTVSGYILNAVLHRIEAREKLLSGKENRGMGAL